jgi:hypothetical protein
MSAESYDQCSNGSENSSRKHAQNPAVFCNSKCNYFKIYTAEGYKSRRMRWAGHVARMGENRNAYKILVVRPEGKRPTGRPRPR